MYKKLFILLLIGLLHIAAPSLLPSSAQDNKIKTIEETEEHECCPQLEIEYVIKKAKEYSKSKGVKLNLPQFDGHFKKYTIAMKGVSNAKKEAVYTSE